MERNLKRGAEMEILTVENAERAESIINIAHPEWGVKRFNYSSEALNDGDRCSSWGIGHNSALLFVHEYKFWHVYKFKEVKQ